MSIRALAWIGPERAHEALVTLRTKLPATEWEAILSARAVLPGWMAKASSEVSVHG